MQAARAIIVENGKVLLFERRRTTPEGEQLHYLSLPGGRVEAHEHAEQAVERELYEEMQLKVRVGPLVAHAYMTAAQWYHSQEHSFYVCERLEGEPTFNPKSEEAATNQMYKPVWRSLDDLSQEPQLHALYRPVMAALLPYLKQGTVPATPIDIDVAN